MEQKHQSMHPLRENTQLQAALTVTHDRAFAISAPISRGCAVPMTAAARFRPPSGL